MVLFQDFKCIWKGKKISSGDDNKKNSNFNNNHFSINKRETPPPDYALKGK